MCVVERENSTRTQYENLINSLRHAYDKVFSDNIEGETAS